MLALVVHTHPPVPWRQRSWLTVSLREALLVLGDSDPAQQAIRLLSLGLLSATVRSWLLQLLLLLHLRSRWWRLNPQIEIFFCCIWGLNDEGSILEWDFLQVQALARARVPLSNGVLKNYVDIQGVTAATSTGCYRSSWGAASITVELPPTQQDWKRLLLATVLQASHSHLGAVAIPLSSFLHVVTLFCHVWRVNTKTLNLLAWASRCCHINGFKTFKIEFKLNTQHTK